MGNFRNDVEKETIIHFNERDKEAIIYTFNPGLKRQLEEFSRRYPALCFMKQSTDDGSVTYIVEKSRLSIRLVPPCEENYQSAERRYAMKQGFKVVYSQKKAS